MTLIYLTCLYPKDTVNKVLPEHRKKFVIVVFKRTSKMQTTSKHCYGVDPRADKAKLIYPLIENNVYRHFQRRIVHLSDSILFTFRIRKKSVSSKPCNPRKSLSFTNPYLSFLQYILPTSLVGQLMSLIVNRINFWVVLP